MSLKISIISTKKVGTVDYFSKHSPNHLWYSNFSQSSNRTSTEKIKPCWYSLILKDNSTIFQKKRYYCTQDYLNIKLEPLVKKKRQARLSSIRNDNVVLLSVQAIEDINLSNKDCVSVFSAPSLSSDIFGGLDSIFISFTSSVVSMLSGRSLGLNTSTSSTASINSSSLTSSIILITEN